MVAASKQSTKRMQTLQLNTLNGELEHFEKYHTRLCNMKEKKIPYYDKLPKDSIFYKHLMQTMYMKSMKKACEETMQQEKNTMIEVKKLVTK